MDDITRRFDAHLRKRDAEVAEYDARPTERRRKRVFALNNKMFETLRPLAALRLKAMNKRDALLLDLGEYHSMDQVLYIKFWGDAHRYAVRHLDLRLRELERADHLYD